MDTPLIEYTYPTFEKAIDKNPYHEAYNAVYGKEHNAVQSDGFFETLVDAVNPLQHIPGVSTLYRAASGDNISSFSRILGGTLIGGPMGFAVSAVNALLQEATGSDAGEHLLAMFESVDAPSVDSASKAYALTHNLR